MDTKKTFIISFLMIIAAWSVPFTIHAATLSISPASETQTVNKNFTVTVYASSNDQALNAVSGVITFPANTLEVVSVSSGGSIIQQWLQQSPTFSNSAGTVSFEGIVMNPGYRGAGGKIMSITFRPKTTGTAQVSFSSASILANDGKGTNILQGKLDGLYIIREAVVVPEPTPAPKKEVAKVVPVEETEKEEEEVIAEEPIEETPLIVEETIPIEEDAFASILKELDDSIKLFVLAQTIIAFFIIFFGLLEYRQRKNIVDKKSAHKALVQEVVEETLARLGGTQAKARTKKVVKTKTVETKTKDNS